MEKGVTFSRDELLELRDILNKMDLVNKSTTVHLYNLCKM